jgi:hypothetical protein
MNTVYCYFQALTSVYSPGVDTLTLFELRRGGDRKLAKVILAAGGVSASGSGDMDVVEVTGAE